MTTVITDTHVKVEGHDSVNVITALVAALIKNGVITAEQINETLAITQEVE